MDYRKVNSQFVFQKPVKYRGRLLAKPQSPITLIFKPLVLRKISNGSGLHNFIYWELNSKTDVDVFNLINDFDERSISELHDNLEPWFNGKINLGWEELEDSHKQSIRIKNKKIIYKTRLTIKSTLLDKLVEHNTYVPICQLHGLILEHNSFYLDWILIDVKDPKDFENVFDFTPQLDEIFEYDDDDGCDETATVIEDYAETVNETIIEPIHNPEQTDVNVETETKTETNDEKEKE